jgi:hypothetical protein
MTTKQITKYIDDHYVNAIIDLAMFGLLSGIIGGAVIFASIGNST